MLYAQYNSNVPFIKELNLQDIKEHTRSYYWMPIVSDGFGSPISIPIMIAKGKNNGPVLGLTAAVHGNELNGISVIQRLFREINIEKLNGTIVAIPVVNVPGFIRKKRRFNNREDLNHIMPGVKDGNVSQVYAYRFVNRVVKHFDYLLDLHTASFGRINSYYIRADMDKPEVRELAMLQNADIIVNNPPSDGTLRGAADELRIPAITLELGNPNTFQQNLIHSGTEGIHNVLCHLNMIKDQIITVKKETVICHSSTWIYTDQGGLLDVFVSLREKIVKDQLIASLKDIFGNELKQFLSPFDGIVIGKSVSPVNQTGGRIVHIGFYI